MSLSSSFSTCPFQSTTVFQSVTGTQPHEQPCQTLACTQVTRSVHYELALTNAIQHTSNVSLLQASVKPCCHLPKQSTFPLLLLCLLYSKSRPHYKTFHNHKILLSFSNAQLSQITTRKERKHLGNITSQQHKRLQRT